MADESARLATWRKLLLIRLFEEMVQDLFADGKILGTCHLCIGQEAVAVGVAEALRPWTGSAGDQVVSCHRGHGHLLAMGGDPVRLLGELMGKQSGYCRGRGGSQHLSVPQIGFLGTNGITGGGIPIATGAALSAQRRRDGSAVVSFFGDGATNQGTFHESLNMAALWRLPILYVCENNRYAMSMPVERGIAGGDILRRVAGYAIRAERVDGMDVDAMRAAASAALDHCRSGKGPAFIEAMTYRFCGHSKSDQLVYRTRDEEAAWRQRDPITVMRKEFAAAGLGAQAKRVEDEVAALLTAASETCSESPDADPADAQQGVYADA